ncbi:MAG: 2,3-butanediol dehydrogenase [Gordonia sp. (in: high G+C Gram-positive bacteria)]|nr:MAG: 2,3-butanediol dehydrogenase [Gordonia sp. (in: high G+C Gram-positive bacteria)]
MKALRYYARNDIRLEDIPEPQTRAGTVKVAVDWCGICGSDLHEYTEGPINMPSPGNPHPVTGEEPPVVLGHEFAGVVTQVGSGVTHVREGDRVAVEPYHTCGSCQACKTNDYSWCPDLGFIGLAGGGGGFSEFVVVPGERAFQLGELSTDLGALVEPLAVGFHAVNASGAGPGQTAVVFGAGPIGLMVTVSLRNAGVDRIVVVEPADVRNAKATAAGADLVLNPFEVNVADILMEMTKGRGADVAFECAGIAAAMSQAIAGTRKGGNIVNVALWGKPAVLDMNAVLLKEISILGSLAYCNDHPATIELVRNTPIDLGQFITKRIALDDVIDGGFHDLMAHKDEHIKVLVHP